MLSRARLRNTFLLATTCLLFLSAAWATEEAPFGRYSYSEKGFDITFSWTPAGISDLKIDGKKFEAATPETYGTYGGNSYFEFQVKASTESMYSVKLLAIYDDSQVATVAAVFNEVVFADIERSKYSIRNVRAFKLKRSA